MNNISLTLIIPVYNVEYYIEKCILSCINQHNVELGRDYEIIVVNDGTPDNSMDIVKRITKSLKGVTIINQDNQGLSMARNNGMKVAKGEYIWFIDSDDWIENDAVAIINSKIKEFSLDIIKIRSYKADSNNVFSLCHKEYNDDRITSGTHAWCEDINNTPVQFSICRKELLVKNKLLFLPKVYHEDNEFTPRLFWHAAKVGFINKPLYFHRVTPNSITQIPNPKRAYDIIEVCKSLHQFSLTKGVHANKLFTTQINRFISMTLNCGFDIIERNVSKETCGNVNKLIEENKQLLAHLARSNCYKYIIEWMLFKITKNYIKMYHFLTCFKYVSKLKYIIGRNSNG